MYIIDTWIDIDKKTRCFEFFILYLIVSLYFRINININKIDEIMIEDYK